ncbi:eae-like domain protein [Enterobacter hormaechei]|nr:eae-like domain protein [Enterobacter hormaechei]
MECNVSELVKRGHDQVAELKASCGAVGVRDVAQLISDLATQLDVQLARSNALAAENAGLKKFITQECHVAHVEQETFYEEEITRYVNADGYEPETTATDAFLAEVRAQGVDAAIATAKNVVAQEFQYKDFETAQRVCSKFPESDLVGKVEMVEWLEEFAAQLRKGVQS